MEALRNEWQFTTVEMVKREGIWHANFVLKTVEVIDSPETIIARGERNLTVAVAIARDSPDKPIRGSFGVARRSNVQEDSTTILEEARRNR